MAVGLCTGVGGAALLIVRGAPSLRLLDALLGFTAGIMLAASMFSLLVPALGAGGVGEVVVGFAIGMVAIALLDRLVPHIHASMIGALPEGTGLNVPEGFAAGAPLLAAHGRVAAASLAAATGIVEPIAAIGAMAALGLVESLLPGALAFAAGAMVYVIVDELIPESHAHGHERLATLGLGAGFVVMMVLDTTL